jgi:hypothetical protein
MQIMLHWWKAKYSMLPVIQHVSDIGFAGYMNLTVAWQNLLYNAASQNNTLVFSFCMGSFWATQWTNKENISDTHNITRSHIQLSSTVIASA